MGVQMTIQKQPLCETCKWLRINKKERLYACKAYPEGIPMEIVSNKIDHRKPYNGDNGIRYEKGK